jgi:hypothetical protein
VQPAERVICRATCCHAIRPSSMVAAGGCWLPGRRWLSCMQHAWCVCRRIVVQRESNFEHPVLVYHLAVAVVVEAVLGVSLRAPARPAGASLSTNCDPDVAALQAHIAIHESRSHCCSVVGSSRPTAYHIHAASMQLVWLADKVPDCNQHSAQPWKGLTPSGICWGNTCYCLSCRPAARAQHAPPQETLQPARRQGQPLEVFKCS